MDAVRIFNTELSSLYESKPPVSRAKMASITKAAIKAIKFYKHVVQSVEKFVMKCKPEYKIPGLYVIDSVVRQSRHQFGGDKDVFGPRFTKNIVPTFQSLLKCSPEDKSRVIRVLNLWQKNTVFPEEIIQSLLNMAADPSKGDSAVSAQQVVDKAVVAQQRSAGKPSNDGGEENALQQQSDIVNTVTKLLQQTGGSNVIAPGQEVQLQQLQLLQQQLMMQTEIITSKSQQTTTPVIDQNLLAQIKLLTDQLLCKTEAPGATSAPPAPPMVLAPGMRLLPPPETRPVQTAPEIVPMGNGSRDVQNMPETVMVTVPRENNLPVEPGFNKKLLDFDYGDSDEEEDQEEMPQVPQQLPGNVHKLLNDPTLMQHIHNVSSLNSEQLQPDFVDHEAARKQHLEQQQEQFNKEIEQQSQYSGYHQDSHMRQDSEIIVVEDHDNGDNRDYDRDRRRSRHSSDRSRSPRRRRHSRSRSRERRRSRDRYRRSRSRDYDRERQREKERERRKKGLPPIKENHISVCSTTLWFGHLAKHTKEEELHSEIENYGTVDSIKMVPPRGCAFVNMECRKEAAKALDRMKGLKLNSSALRVAWAPNIGVKESQFKDKWDVELGVTYIPWDKLPSDLTPLTDGAIIDEDSLPEHLRGTVITKKAAEEAKEKMADTYNAVPNNQIPGFGGIPPSQHMSMPPPPLIMPPSGQMQMPIPLPNPPFLPPNMLPQPGPVSAPMPPPQGGLLGSSSHGPSMDGSAGRPGMPLISCSPLMPPGQQPGILARPGFPPMPPFGMPPNMRPGMPPPRQGLRPPFQEADEPKEWPGDDRLDDSAEVEMEDEDNSRGVMISPAATRHIPLPVMRMGVPGAPHLPGGPVRPGAMVELPQPVSSPGMPLGRPGLLGLIPNRAPQEGPEGMMPPQMPPGLLGHGLAPGNLPMGQQLGLPGSPGFRGMGPRGGPIRFALGPRTNLVRRGGPFGLENPPPIQMDDVPSSSQNNPPLLEDGPSDPSSDSQGHLVGAASNRGHPGLLGVRPNLPVNGGLPLGPRPDFIRGPAIDKAVAGEGSRGGMKPDTEAQGDDSPEYGECSSPEYGEGCDEMEESATAENSNFRRDSDVRTNVGFHSLDTEQQNSGVAPKRGPERTKSGRISRWSNTNTEDDANTMTLDRRTGANGSTGNMNNFHPSQNEQKNGATIADRMLPSHGLSEG